MLVYLLVVSAIVVLPWFLGSLLFLLTFIVKPTQTVVSPVSIITILNIFEQVFARKQCSICMMPTSTNDGHQNVVAFKEFLNNGKDVRTPAVADLVILDSWKSITLAGYNTAVKKFLRFCDKTKEPFGTLPITGSTLERFCVWAERNRFSTNTGKFNSTSLRKYIMKEFRELRVLFLLDCCFSMYNCY